MGDAEIAHPILIVEDSEPLAQMMSAMLAAQWHCEVHVANTYAEAKSYLSRYRFDYHIALCDLNLPDAPNAEIIDLVNKAKVQWIAISGTSDASLVNEAMTKGAIDFIDKANINAYPYAADLVRRLYKNYQVKILIVDDSPSALDIAAHMLKKQNFEVLEAMNGKQALQVLEQHKDIKVILTDYAMPEMDGVALTVKVRKTYPKENIAIIGISGMGGQELSSNFIKNGANDF